MTQEARPDADTADGTWINQSENQTNLYASVDEASHDDSTTFIKCTDETGNNEVVILRLSDVSAPGSGDAYIKYRAVTQDNMMGGYGPGLKLELLEGDGSGGYDVRASTQNDAVEYDGSTWTSYSYTISDVSGITDWTDLYIRLTMMTTSGMGDVMYVTQVYLQTQDAAAAAAPAADPDLPGAAFLMFID